MELSDIQMYKIEVYLPVDAVEAVRKALQKSGAGVIGNYDNTFVTSEVTGHWRPLEGADPTIGKIGELETAAELKLETTCRRDKVAAAIKAIREAHPYEEPVIQVVPLLNQFFA